MEAVAIVGHHPEDAGVNIPTFIQLVLLVVGRKHFDRFDDLQYPILSLSPHSFTFLEILLLHDFLLLSQ